MPVIQIEPLDTLFFRDGKPFNMGDETWAEGMFPPNPSVIWGALFSALHGDEIRDGNILDESKLVITNLGIYQEEKNKNEVYYPMPKDVFWYTNNKDNVEFIKSNDCTIEQINKKDYLLYTGKYNIKSPNNYFISSGALNNYIKGLYPNDISNFIHLNNLIKNNPKIGIKRNNHTRSSEEGNLFRVDMIELNQKKQVQLFVEYEGIQSGKINFKLGGESKFVHGKIEPVIIEILNKREDARKRRDKLIEESEIFKIYFLTSFILKLKDKNELYDFFSIDNISYLTIVTDKISHVGGFDYKEKKPKAMMKAFPAGTVVYLKKEKNKSVEDYKNILITKLIEHSNYNKGFAKFDFAHTKIGDRK